MATCGSPSRGKRAGNRGIAKAVVRGLPDVPVPTAVTRLYGADRFGTANAIAQSEYPAVESAQGVVLARADAFPDALAGSALAVKLNAPLLLTQSATLGYTVIEIERVLSPGKTVTVLGGTDAISKQLVMIWRPPAITCSDFLGLTGMRRQPRLRMRSALLPRSCSPTVAASPTP